MLQSKGETIAGVVRQPGISEITHYKWRKEYGGLRVGRAKRLKELEKEDGRLRKGVADLTIDNLM